MTSAAALTALLVGIAGVAVSRRHRRVSLVAPELRHPMLYVPISLRGDTALRIGRRIMARAMPVAAGDRTESVPAAEGRPALRVLLYERTGRTRPTGALLWIHGGGLVMGLPEQDHELCSHFAERLGIVVVSVDYRLAPEHPFPAGLEDCYAALAWLHAQADALGIDPTRVALGGGSAGGGLAACLARPYAAAARRVDLAGLAPAWIGIGDIDLFHDECVDYAKRLRDAGVPTELHVVPGMYHGAEHFVPGAPSMRTFLDRMTSALRAGIS